MTNINEINEQIAKIDALLQEAYSTNNISDIVLFGDLITKLFAQKATIEAVKPVPVMAWKNATTEIAARSSALEAMILARDEKLMMEF